jgi:hypothetical protein
MRRIALIVLTGLVAVYSGFITVLNVPMSAVQGNHAVHHFLADNDEPLISTTG